jgi:hypothetical protein
VYNKIAPMQIKGVDDDIEDAPPTRVEEEEGDTLLQSDKKSDTDLSK